MNVYVNELKTGKLQKYNSVQYTRNCDLTTTLRNLHKEEHSAGCFKFYIECRMKQPCKPSDVTHFIWETKEHEWYDWKGRRSTVNHFFVEHKREHADCFVNINNRVISEIFQCNTNVAVAVDGRSIMYITNYISKNTNKEDNAIIIIMIVIIPTTSATSKATPTVVIIQLMMMMMMMKLLKRNFAPEVFVH